MTRLKGTPAERTLARIRVDENGCWIFTGAIGGGGYGYVGGGRKGLLLRTHRVVYEHLIGPIPYELELDHLCRVRACCNPKHLEPVTSLENKRRGAAGPRTHCPKGHEYTPENTYWQKRDDRAAGATRSCLTCRRERNRKVAEG